MFLKILKFPKNPISSVKSPVALKISTVKSPEETLFFSDFGDFFRSLNFLCKNLQRLFEISSGRFSRGFIPKKCLRLMGFIRCLCFFYIRIFKKLKKNKFRQMISFFVENKYFRINLCKRYLNLCLQLVVAYGPVDQRANRAESARAGLYLARLVQTSFRDFYLPNITKNLYKWSK